jgi:hypothetical protein
MPAKRKTQREWIDGYTISRLTVIPVLKKKTTERYAIVHDSMYKLEMK